MFPKIYFTKTLFCVCTNVVSGRPKKSDIDGKHFDNIAKHFAYTRKHFSTCKYFSFLKKVVASTEYNFLFPNVYLYSYKNFQTILEFYVRKLESYLMYRIIFITYG